MINDEQLLDIVRCGVLAPSADNQHVFRFDITGGSINLWPSPEFASAPTGHRRILGLLSLGAVVENMRQRAGELGFAAKVEWSLGNSHGQIAKLVFVRSPYAVGDLAAAIPTRHTNRRMYRGPTLTDVESAALNNAVENSHEVRLIWLKGPARRKALGLIWHAESERFLRERLHREVFSSIRFDLSWTESAEWALPPGTLHIEAPMRPVFKALRHWRLMHCLTWLGVHRLIGLRAGWLPCWQAPGLGVLASSMPLEKGAVVVGAAFERLWLRADILNLALQPLAASVVLPLQNSTDNGASKALQTRLHDGWQELADGQCPLMVFRIGRAARPAIRTTRPAIEHFRKQ